MEVSPYAMTCDLFVSFCTVLNCCASVSPDVFLSASSIQFTLYRSPRHVVKSSPFTKSFGGQYVPQLGSSGFAAVVAYTLMSAGSDLNIDPELQASM